MVEVSVCWLVPSADVEDGDRAVFEFGVRRVAAFNLDIRRVFPNLQMRDCDRACREVVEVCLAGMGDYFHVCVPFVLWTGQVTLDVLGEISDKNGFSKSTRKTMSTALYNGFSNRAVIRGNPKRVARNVRI